MNENFSDAAPYWCSVATRLLSWRPSEFWRATPAELTTALRDPTKENSIAGPSRDRIAQMMERDING